MRGAAAPLRGQFRGNFLHAALSALDSNHDGHINAKDTDFSKLQVWVDANHDGKTDAGELKTLADLGIADLNLGATKGTDVDHGNLIGLVSSYTKSDGSTHEMSDVWFTKDGATQQMTGTTREAAPQLGDLLAHPEAHLLGGGTAPIATSVTAATTAASTDTVNHDVLSAAYKKLHDDDQNSAAPLI